MVKFEPVDPDEILGDHDSKMLKTQGTHGRVSGSLLQMFLETGHYMARLDRTGIKLGLQNLKSSMTSYAIGHRMPVEVIRKEKDIYLRRTDVDRDGKPLTKDNVGEPVIKLTPEKVNELMKEGMT